MLAMRAVPAAVRYTTFQTQWLQRVRTIVEKGEPALDDAQDADEQEEEERVPAMVGYVAVLLLRTRRNILSIFQTIAREVFRYQQSRVVAKQEPDIPQEDQEDNDDILSEETEDALYRVGGAQLHRMIELRKLKEAGRIEC